MIDWQKVWFYLTLPLRPSYWIMNYTYSKEWDRKLRKLMRSATFEPNGRHTAYLDGYEVWVSNHPYASFRWYDYDLRPSRYTIWEARQKFEKDIIDHA